MRPQRLVVLSFLALVAMAASASAQSLVRVSPGGDLQAAINSVADGGVIEMAGGTYPSPANGWLIANEGRGFTIRAAQGAQVVLDGGRSRRILRFENGTRNRGRLVTFDGLTFRNGAGDGGAAVNLIQAEAVFRDCVFEDNAASPNSAYGAVRAFTGTDVTFARCTFRGNQARVRGGALSVERASAVIQGCTFRDNRVNQAGHDPGSAGGAVYILDSTVRVADSHFEGNEAGWVGGALYAIGVWADPVSTPRADVRVTRSTFLDNRAEPHGCCNPPGPTTGGAVHAEDQTTMTLEGSRFVGNEALHGGAVSGYRAIVEVRGSVFQGNRSLTAAGGGGAGAGGAINMTSNEFADASTGNGTINRRPARLTATDSWFQGRFGATTTAAHVGGCLLAGGDASRMYGENGVAAAGGLADNRAVVVLRNTVFFDCDVERTADGQGGFGGGIQADLTDLTLEDSMVLHSDARGTNAGGGGMSVSRDSHSRIARTTFARNTGEARAGAVDLGGSTLELTASRFLANEVSPGVNEGTNQSLGAALYSIPLLAPANPARARNVAGVVSNTLFSDNAGVPVFDIDPQSGPINDVRYDGNQFFSSRPVYVNTLTDPGRQGSSVAQLNALVVSRPGRPSTDKSLVANQQLNAAPRVGDLVAVPPGVPVGAPSSPGNAFLAYAWTGGRSATLNGQALSGRSGVMEVAPGTYTLAVDGVTVDQTTVGASSCTTGSRLCLRNDRFRLEVSWRTRQGETGSGQAVRLTGDTGYFWFFNSANVELVVKVLDGRALNGHFWVFYGALSDVQYTLTVTDTATGRVKTYNNPQGQLASRADTSAFPAGGAAADAATASLWEEDVVAAPEPVVTALDNACAAGATQLCLNASRFRVQVTWEAQGSSGSGQAVPLTSDTGYFWFFDPANVELVVKVLDGRALNGHFWVFYGALSDVRYTVTVTDTVTGRSKTYTNPAGTLASRADTQALPSQ
ncbi:MAG TPA: right-handed parallel beta-helix repeat-containing protein [Thermoanaerobaculia bacterium]|nr:right-handed parallel beta-helix repeat-containing protein [Thermoanaerobaculia bacterium]